MDEVEKFDVRKGTRLLHVKIQNDPDCSSPLEDEDDIKIAYFSGSRYTLGNDPVSRERMDEIKDGIEKGTLIGMPVYAYIHSGIALATEPFSCPWDSGQSGFVYCDAKWGEDAFGKGKALEVLRSVVETYGAWLAGETYGYSVEDETGKVLDDCWGFIGMENVTSEARSAAEHLLSSAAA